MITVVSGEPRSGTSLMMRLLEGLGLQVEGSSVIVKKRSEKHYENAKDLNPKGFYEVPGVVMRGIPNKHLDNYDDKVVKLITPALLKTNYQHIGKIIFCLRDPREIALSQQKLSSQLEVTDKDNEWQFAPGGMEPNYKRYTHSISRLFGYLQFNPNILYKTLFINYHDVVFKTEKILLDICNHLEIGVSKNTIKEAVKLNDPSLYRSKDFKDSNNRYSDMAMYLYNELKTQEYSDEVFHTIKKFMMEEAKERIMWLDDDEFGTWVRMKGSLYRSVKINNRGVRDKLIEGANTIRLPYRPTNCFFYKLSDEKYTIKRPIDIEDLIRTKIDCAHQKQLLTRERCLACWLGLKHKFSMYQKHEKYKKLLDKL